MKSIVTIFLFLVSITLAAQQDFQGKAVYQSKTTVDMDNFGNGRIPEDRKKEIMERMRSMLEKTFVLDFNASASIYKEEEKLEMPGGPSGGWGMRIGGMAGTGTLYKNIKEAEMIEATEFFGKNFLIDEQLEKPEWELSGETKQIGNYTCFKATLLKKTNAFDFAAMRRRNTDENTDKTKDTANTKKVTDEIEMPKEILVTAWYTPQIPVSNGPAEYWGLPGLILEINAARTTILCSEITLNPKEKIEIKAPDKGKEVTREEYDEIVKKKMEEMREMYRGRRGDGGWRRSN
ncbi:MAG: GLPGLI family protein [Flavobacteriaceae bacterium]|nr:GLPGLI family protein [Flavobacteriaceae bacterium]